MLIFRFRRLAARALLFIGVKVATICKITGYSKVTVYKIKKKK
mgnify:FL=1